MERWQSLVIVIGWGLYGEQVVQACTKVTNIFMNNKKNRMMNCPARRRTDSTGPTERS
jgi:hypothetical protein